MVFNLDMSDWTTVKLFWDGYGDISDVCTVKHCHLGGTAGACEKWFVHGTSKDIANADPWTESTIEVTDPSDRVLFYTTYVSPPGSKCLHSLSGEDASKRAPCRCKCLSFLSSERLRDDSPFVRGLEEEISMSPFM